MAISRTNNGWCVDFYVGNRRVRKKGFDTQNKAKLYIHKSMAHIPDVRDSMMQNNYSTMLISEIADVYLDEVLSKGKSYSNQYFVYKVVDKWGHYIVGNMQNSEVIHWVRSLLLDYSVATSMKYLSYLKRIINYSIEMGVIPYNPIKTVSFKKEAKKANCRNFSMDYIRFQEFYKLFDDSPTTTKQLILAMWHTGMRIGELIALEWKDLSLETGLIVLSADRVKEGTVRTIAMENEVIEMFKAMFPDRRGKFVFAVSSRRNIGYQTVYLNYKKAIKGTEYSHYNMHDLRHSYVKRKRQEGFDREVIKVQTGHKTDSMFNRYNDIDADEVLQMAGFNDQRALAINSTVSELITIVKNESIPMSAVYSSIRKYIKSV